MMQNELVQDDHGGNPVRVAAHEVEDPAVGIRVVANMVDSDVDSAWQPPGSPAHGLDVCPPLERRQQQAAVVGDPRTLGRKRRDVGDVHERSAPTTESQVSRSARPLPAWPRSRATAGCSANQRQARATSAGVDSQTIPLTPSTTASSGPPASRVVTTGRSARKASYGT